MNDRFFVSLGWWWHLTCAALYVIAGLRSGDWLGVAGSFLFLAATVAFLIPHYRKSSGARVEAESNQ